MNTRAIVVGCGGIGAWLATFLAKAKPGMILIDGDMVEKGNFERQHFEPEDLGQLKAEVLGRRLGCQWIDDWFPSSRFSPQESDMLLCCVDNNAARRSVLDAVDDHHCMCIIAANETRSAEAYLYRHEWLRTPCDPRVHYPELLLDNAANPAEPRGCLHLMQNPNTAPQTVAANILAASAAMLLERTWGIAQELPPEEFEQLIPRLPMHVTANTSFASVSVSDRMSQTVNPQTQNV